MRYCYVTDQEIDPRDPSFFTEYDEQADKDIDEFLGDHEFEYE